MPSVPTFGMRIRRLPPDAADGDEAERARCGASSRPRYHGTFQQRTNFPTVDSLARLSVTFRHVGAWVTKPKLTVVIFLCTLVAGCGNANPSEVYDPLEPVNREVFAFNHALDKNAALPAATAYKHALPDGMREGVHNFLSNLTLPVTFANDILQGEVTQAGYSVCRLGVNTTVGILGFMDPASEWGCPEHDEDFGQTLAVYGVPGGPYLVIPLLGSTLPRDLAGKLLVDHYFNPLGYVTYRGKYYVSVGESLIKLVDRRSRAVSALNDIARTSIDYYPAMRSIYLQKRNSAIENDSFSPDPLSPDTSTH